MPAPIPVPNRPTALLLCDDDTGGCEVLRRTVEAAGFELIAMVKGWPKAVQRVADEGVDLVVVDIAQAGSLGLRLIEVLHLASPRCRVIVLDSLGDIQLAALEAGAFEVVAGDDLRPLTAALQRIATERSHV